MDLSRLKKVLAGVSVAAFTLTQVGTVIAAYSDVPAGVWYEEAVEAFLDAGYLDANQPRFRGGDTANRAEFTKLIVEMNGGILSTPPAVPSFDDVATSAWYYGYMEEAGKEGWVRGDNNCYGSHPCRARPGSNINRAEAAALIVRAFGLEGTGDADQFVDNPSGQWYTDSIQSAADHCVLQGDDGSGRVRPGDNMNRAEMVVMLHRVDQDLTFGVDCGTEEEGGEVGVSNAVATSSTTVEVEFSAPLDIETAEDTDHYSITGSPELEISSAVVVNAGDGEDTVELTVAQAMEANHEYTLTVSDLMSSDGVEFSDSTTFSGYSTLVKGEGVLEASVAASNPVGDSIPQGAVGVVMLSVDLTASCDDSVTIESLTLLHEGFGAVADIGGVYAAIDGARVSRKRTIDAEDQTSELRFSSPLVINACDTVTVDLVADYSSSATTAAEHNFVVELPSDFVGNAKEVTGNFPLRGNTFRVAAVDSGTVSVTYRTVSPDEVEVGDKAVVVGKFELSTDSVEDQTFYSMTFEQNSSASDGDFTNIAIRRTDGTVLTNTVAQTVGDFVTLVFDPPFTILEGDKITLEVIADIVGGAGDSIIMHFEESSDIFAVGSLYGYGVNGQLYGSQIALPTESTTLPDTVTIDAGEFTIEISGPSQQSYTRDDNDAVLAKIIFTTGGEKVDMKDLFIALEGQTSSGLTLARSNGTATDNLHEVLEDVEIRNTVTGRTIDGVRLTGTSDFGQANNGVSSSTNSGTYQVYRFDDFIVNGKETWEFRVDFIDNGTTASPRTGDQFRVHICGEPTHISSSAASVANTTGCTFAGLIVSSTAYQMQIEGVSTGDRVLDVRPRGTITGNFHRIANATLTVAVKAIGTGDTAVSNAKNINLLRFEARAGEAEDILFTKSIFESKSGSLANAINYSLWVDSDGDSKVDTKLEDGVASQNAQVTFSELAGGGFVIPKEETVLFEIHGDVSASLTNDDLQIQFATGSSVQNAYIEAEELDDGSSLTGIKTNATCQTDTDATAEANCDVTVSTTDSQRWTLINQGDLFVTKDSTPTKSRQLLGGALGETILRLQFHAENEPVDVTDLQLTTSGSIGISVDRLELYKDGESTFFALATIGGCGSDAVRSRNGVLTDKVATFCANMEGRQLVVPEGADVDVLVRPRMKTDVAGAVQSGGVVQLFVDHTGVSNNSTGSGAVRARGDESSNNLSANDADPTAEGEVFIGTATAAASAIITGSRNETVLAKIISITNANPDANGTNVPTGISPVGQFKFTAAAHTNSKNGLNDAVLSGIIFNITATNVNLQGSGFYLYNKADSSTKQNCKPFATNTTTLLSGVPNGNASGSFIVECKGLDAAAINTEIDQGADATFVLEGNIQNAQISSSASSTLQVSFQDFTTLGQKTFRGDVSTGNHIHWEDKDSTTTNFYWIEYPDTVVKSTSYQS